jgi:hypothetical protein
MRDPRFAREKRLPSSSAIALCDLSLLPHALNSDFCYGVRAEVCVGVALQTLLSASSSESYPSARWGPHCWARCV